MTSTISTTQVLITERLTLGPWRLDDAQAALDVFGHAEMTRWLSPDMDQVPDLAAMRLLLQQWIAEDARLAAPAGRWAIRRNHDDRVIGGAILLPLPPGNEDLEIGWQLHPDAWGSGYASEATHALATWAFSQDIHDIFAVVRPRRRHRPAQRHALGRRNHQILRHPPAGVPTPSRPRPNRTRGAPSAQPQRGLTN